VRKRVTVADETAVTSTGRTPSTTSRRAARSAGGARRTSRRRHCRLIGHGDPLPHRGVVGL